jgi:hypothetical protein
LAECTVCTRPSADSNLCPSCLDELCSQLRRVPWLVEQLMVTFARMGRTGERNGGRSAERPLPYDPRAAVDLESLDAGLTMWARAVAEQRGVVVDASGAVALAAWLLRWKGEVAQHADAGELFGDVVALVKAATYTVDLPPQRHYCGPCDLCSEDLYVGQLARTVVCRTEGCEFSADVAERRVWLLEHAVDQLRTAAELSRELPWIGGVVIDRKRINQWASRGLGGFQLTPYGPHPRDPHGRTRFRLGEVLDFARRAVSESPARVAG